jgi:hypothetical protein
MARFEAFSWVRRPPECCTGRRARSGPEPTLRTNPRRHAYVSGKSSAPSIWNEKAAALSNPPRRWRGHFPSGSVWCVVFRFRKKLKGIQEQADFEVRLEGGSISRVVRDAAVRQQADLVVIGRGHVQAPLSRLRTNACAIIREAPCPVLSVLDSEWPRTFPSS